MGNRGFGSRSVNNELITTFHCYRRAGCSLSVIHHEMWKSRWNFSCERSPRCVILYIQGASSEHHSVERVIKRVKKRKEEGNVSSARRALLEILEGVQTIIGRSEECEGPAFHARKVKVTIPGTRSLLPDLMLANASTTSFDCSKRTTRLWMTK